MRLLNSEQFTARMALRYLNKTKNKDELTALSNSLSFIYLLERKTLQKNNYV